MKERERLDYTINPDLKPLYANLKRLEIGKYLIQDSLTNLLVELDWDEEWSDCQKELNINMISDYSEYEEAFFILMNLLYDDLGVDDAAELLAKIILDFVKWSPSSIDLKDIGKSLDKLNVYEGIINDLEAKAKKLNKKKSVTTAPASSKSISGNKVFIIHGHDEVARLQLEKMLKEEFNLTPIVIQDNPNESFDTIISKFERLANECALAFALFTPDDKLSDKDYRARQNVILELGYFMGRDQQTTNRRIIILRKGNVEIPSDIKGVIYYQFESTIKELYLDLKKQLEHWKVIE
jgi:predicted nucleotide-binding protein